jgi:hypothetical protein
MGEKSQKGRFSGHYGQYKMPLIETALTASPDYTGRGEI